MRAVPSCRELVVRSMYFNVAIDTPQIYAAGQRHRGHSLKIRVGREPVRIPEGMRRKRCYQVVSSGELGLEVATAEVWDEHLFDGLVVGDKDVARGMAADQVTDFFGEVLGVIAGALEGLGHEDNLE